VANKNQLVLGQVKTDEKSNEITAIPALIDLMELKGCIVTIDARLSKGDNGKIIKAKADYVLELKGNQSGLHDDVKLYFENEKAPGFWGTRGLFTLIIV
jgi:predicted transposase YbfD/YdcC